MLVADELAKGSTPRSGVDPVNCGMVLNPILAEPSMDSGIISSLVSLRVLRLVFGIRRISRNPMLSPGGG